MKRPALALLLSLAAAAAARGQEPQTVRDWSIKIEDRNPKTGQDETVAVIKGKEAVVRDKTPERVVADLRGVEATYYTEPKEGNPSREIRIAADEAKFDNGAGRLTLTRGARVVRTDDGTTLEAPVALVLFHRRHSCPKCAKEAAAPGSCPDCKVPLRTKTHMTLRAEREFVLRKPGLQLAGEGLTANDELLELSVERNGSIEMIGRPSDVGEGAPKRRRPPGEFLTRLRCRGPLTVKDDLTRVAIAARDDVRIEREELEVGITRIFADAVDISAARVLRLEDLGRELSPRRVEARGRVRLEESSGVRALAERLEWESRSDPGPLAGAGGPAVCLLGGLGALAYDEAARLEGAPLVSLTRGTDTIRSRSVRIDTGRGVAFFEGDVDAAFARPGDPGGRPIRLKSRSLHLETIPAGREPEVRRIEALGDVVLEGLMEREGEPPATATAERFVWNPSEDRGILEGRPFARVTQGSNDILAPRILLEGRGGIVLQGPKRIRVTEEREGKIQEFTVTSEGDIVLDNNTGRARLHGGCRVRSRDFQLSARRMEILFKAGGKGVESVRAAGDVRVRRAVDGSRVFGDRMSYEPSRETLEVRGYPQAVVDAGGRLVFAQILRTDGKTGFTQFLRGDQEGIRIVIREDAR